MKKLIVALALVALPADNVTAQFYGGGALRWGPNGNGTLEHEDDLKWVIFHDAKITADEARGVYRATFSHGLADENGRTFSITGYMLPVERNTNSPHFVLTRRSTGCPFCPPNEPTEAIEVFATGPVAYTQAPITIEGRLRLVSESAQGLFFRFDAAKKL